MAVKKTQLYASLWASCDKLRGGMDSSEYKDYILTLLFMKYVTDKYNNKGAYEDVRVFDKAHDPDPDPEKRTGCSFNDFIDLKKKKNIGEGMDKVVAKLAEVNPGLQGVIDTAHFNDEKKLGSGQEMVDKLTDLISIFQRPELDFSKNKAEGDDIIGDAYEYLMRKFATESGKSKGQFYTPAEVSRVLADVVGIRQCQDQDATVYDPACGSGSLLIRALDAAPIPNLLGYGQEKEITTAGLAKMNAVLHRRPEVTIKSGNTFSSPQYLDAKDNTVLRRFDYIVANPPFSMKNWRDGLAGKEYDRFEGYGAIPPETNGDYAWLLHILKSLKTDGKAAVILPHGVLFRGNAEGTIRKAIIQHHWLKGIIGLPANLFYGTGIPACIIVIDKENADTRRGIFMIDASRDYRKDGNKNRLRERDIYKIVTTFNEEITTDSTYARFVTDEEIEANDYNLNISRYLTASETEDIQDIYAHLHGGIPALDIQSLEKYWQAFPSLQAALLTPADKNYYQLNVSQEAIRQAIYQNKEFAAYGEKIEQAFGHWQEAEYPVLAALPAEINPQQLIAQLAEYLLADFKPLTLLDKYDVYQVLLGYWTEIMNDDVSLIVYDKAGYDNARVTDNIEEVVKSGKNKGQIKVSGWDGRLIPKEIVIDEFFGSEKQTIQATENRIEEADNQLAELIENADENSALAEIAENGKVKMKDIMDKEIELTFSVKTAESVELEKLYELLPQLKKKKEQAAYLKEHPLCIKATDDKGKITKTAITNRLQIIRTQEAVSESIKQELKQLQQAADLSQAAADYKKEVNNLKISLDKKCREKYAHLTDAEILDLLVNKKWFASLHQGLTDLYAGISQYLTKRLTELAERYAQPLPELEQETVKLEAQVKSQLEGMGFQW